MFTTVQELEASLLSGGLSPTGARFVAERAKPGVILTTQAVASEDEIPLGATKIGGRPDLPADFAWPVRPPYPDAAEQHRSDLGYLDDDPDPEMPIPDEIKRVLRRKFEADAAAAMREAPLAFVAQIDLAAVAAAGSPGPDLPREGRWLLFYDLVRQPWGFRPSDVLGARLVFDSSPVHALARREFPGEIARHRFAPLRCAAATTLVPFKPRSGDPGVGLDADDSQALSKWTDRQTLLGLHRVGGYPWEIQGDMAQECVLVSRGIDLSDGLPEGAADGIDTARERQGWVFLFQIASDDRNGMTWVDDGMLYLWIHRDALRARRFEEARLILQCY